MNKIKWAQVLLVLLFLAIYWLKEKLGTSLFFGLLAVTLIATVSLQIYVRRKEGRLKSYLVFLFFYTIIFALMIYFQLRQNL